MLRPYVTQVDDDGDEAISIDEWLEFWRNVLAQVTLPLTPTLALAHARAGVLRGRGCRVAWLPSYHLCTCYSRRIATRRRT